MSALEFTRQNPAAHFEDNQPRRSDCDFLMLAAQPGHNLTIVASRELKIGGGTVQVDFAPAPHGSIAGRHRCACARGG